MMFGGQADDVASQRMIGRTRDAGVNFIDTADVYNNGRPEEVVGKAVHADRSRWVIATKVNGMVGPEPNERGSSRKWILEAVRRSLARLGTDYIDIYYLHREDLETPLEESVRAMGDLVRSGAIRYFALSNHRGLARRRDLQHLRRTWYRSTCRQPAALQCAQSHGRRRALAGGRLLRTRYRAL